MSNLRSAARKLDRYRVMLAKETERQRIEVAKKVVKERAEKDLEFAQDVLKAVGDNLPKEIKEACEATVARETKKAEETEWLLKKAALEDDAMVSVGGDLTHTLVPEQTDGGGTILVSETELPEYPRDGDSKKK